MPAGTDFPTQAAIYRSLIWLLSRPAWRDYGDEMTALFCHHLGRSGGLRGRAGVWFAALEDLARHGGALRRRGRRPSKSPSPGPRMPMSERIRQLVAAFRRDAIYAVRLLRKDWSFTLMCTLILGLAIGANTAVFSFIDTYMLRPLPYPSADRLAVLEREWAQGGVGSSHDGRTWFALADLETDSFRAAVYSGWRSQANLAVGDQAMSVAQQRVGAGYFGTLGVPPMLGREFNAAEDVPDGPPVTILSHELWQQVFGGDANAVGDTLLLRGEPHQVLGVMPPDFTSAAGADLWTPLGPMTTGEGEGTNYSILVRLSEGASWAAADAEVAALGQSLSDSPDDRRQFTLRLTSLQSSDAAGLRQLIFVVWSSVGVVLLIACVNVSGLLLARGSRRSREIATRMAIGGGRAAMVRQFLVESLVLAAAGGLAGVVMARVMLGGLLVVGSQVMNTWRPVTLDARVLLGCAVIALGTSLVFGLAPAFQATRVNIHDALRGGGARGVAGGSQRWRRGLVVAEIGLSVILLVMAGLLLRTFLHLQGLEPGFNPDNVVAISVSLQDARYEARRDADRLFQEGLERIRALPATASATVALGLPYERLLNLGFQPIDFDKPEGTGQIINLVYVTEDYFETLGVPMLAGRSIEATDNSDASAVAVVNERFVEHYMQDPNAVGRIFSVSGTERTIVGVAGTVKQRGSVLQSGPVDGTPTVFVPVAQVSDGFLTLVHTWFQPSWIVRVNGDLGTAIPQIEAALGAVDPLLPLGTPRQASELQSAAVARQRFLAVLVGILASASIVLAGLGIFGLVAATVAERNREIGIRMALGADAGRAIRFAAMPSMKLSLVGAVIGIAGSIYAGRALRAYLWGVAPEDPGTYLGVVVTLLVAAAIASLIPASRAARVDPARTLQAE